MGILDDAIREHIDLKRRHGARDAELRELEDEAFGSTEQPDPFAAGSELFNEVTPTPTGEEAPTGTATETPVELGGPDLGGEEPTRLVEPEALRTGEPASEEPSLDLNDEPIGDEPISPPEGLEQIPGQAELPDLDEIPGQESLDDVAEPPSPSESLEELIAEEEPFPEDADAPEPAQPESSVPEPPPPPPADGPEPPGRARGRVDVPTQEHPPPGQTGDLPSFPSESSGDDPADEALPLDEPEAAEEPGPETGTPELYDFESDEGQPPSTDSSDDFEALGPAEEDAPYEDDERPYSDDPGSGTDVPLDEPSTAVRPALEDEEAYEGGGPDPEESFEEDDEDLWFEKGPPKDFDFD
jgi:hypothetical protein